MIIQLNDKKIHIHTEISLEKLLQTELNITPEKKGIAVAVNENIIPKQEWKNYLIKDNDTILVITAAQGG
ncbi:MAG: sulfur carrier protein ThiS [Bacteroidia bacterium]